MKVDRIVAFRVRTGEDSSDVVIISSLVRRSSSRPVVEFAIRPKGAYFTWSAVPGLELVSILGREEFYLDDPTLLLDVYWEGDPMPTWYEEMIRWSV